jgi:hypothetical protein
LKHPSLSIVISPYDRLFTQAQLRDMADIKMLQKNGMIASLLVKKIDYNKRFFKKTYYKLLSFNSG